MKEGSGMGIELAKALVATLPKGVTGLFNPWADVCEFDKPTNGPKEKLARLGSHLECEPEFILCGEAPGYQGCRHSGIAFTSEFLLVEGAIPRVGKESIQLTHNKSPLKEPSATIVWRALYELAIAEKTILWNAVMLHPHIAGERRGNRTPSDEEIALGKPALEILMNRFPHAKFIAVGKKAEGIFNMMGVPVFGCVRHPANGGATEFRAGLARLVSLKSNV